jgi:hypothetical protein
MYKFAFVRQQHSFFSAGEAAAYSEADVEVVSR